MALNYPNEHSLSLVSIEDIKERYTPSYNGKKENSGKAYQSEGKGAAYYQKYNRPSVEIIKLIN